MQDNFRGWISLLAVLALTAAAPRAAEIPDEGATRFQKDDGATRRLALVIGSHEGGPGRDRLVYAGADAAAFRRTLEELGGLREGDATLLVDPDSVRILRALDDLEARVRALKRAGSRVEALVYYSGHANEKGLLLGTQGIDYRVFRTRMNSLGADVRIAVVDACESGALTRLKGGHTAPAFLVDKSIRSEGYAILTSSSESESAQESDRVGGSFFTNALNSGLRGAADASRDGKVTLHEAYQFAYNETLARTETSRGGPQHAGYDIQLNGSGDVVLTDLRQGSSFADLSEDLTGRLFIRDSSGHLVAELQKPAGRDMRLGLSAGVYEVRLLRDGAWRTASVTLPENQATLLTPATFRGGSETPDPAVAGARADEDADFHYVPSTAPGGFSSAILYDWVKTEWRGTQLAPVGTGARSHLRGGQMSLVLNSTGGDLEGFQAAVGGNIGGGSLHGMQFSTGANAVARNFKGAQITTGVNIVGEHATGVQAAVGLNTAGAGLEGWQASVGFNIAGGGVSGGQVTVGFNIAADSLKGAQAAVGFNIAGDSVLGGQAAVGFNIAGGGVKGGQGAVGFNAAAGDVKGGQGAVGFNAAAGDVKGGQGAVGFNVAAGEVKGGQGAVGFNYAGGLRGFQAAVGVNIAGKVRGTQIGLINLSDEYESGAPIGLLNISRKGSFEAETWVEENGMTFAGLRTGVNWMHSHVAVGTQPLRDGPYLLAPTLGASAHFPVGVPRLYGEAGLFHSMVFSPEHPTIDGDFQENDWSRVRAGVGLKVFSFLTLTGGLTYNVFVHGDTDTPIIGESKLPFFVTHRMTHGNVSLWPGAYVGLRLGK
jgi:hypothetical protein